MGLDDQPKAAALENSSQESCVWNCQGLGINLARVVVLYDQVFYCIYQ